MPRGLLVSAILIILFGLAEVATGMTGNFADVVTATPTPAYVLASVSIGVLYVLAGLLVLTMTRLGAGLAIVFLAADVAGRLGMVATGLYPFSGVDAFAIAAGTAIAALFAAYMALRRGTFR
jgi:hypothetical protein